uniref:Uncharacterized protein n=1 Tax=Peronospora matthiolae TaxID=2874970 RepID=A0AAV1VKS0_9STRA
MGLGFGEAIRSTCVGQSEFRNEEARGERAKEEGGGRMDGWTEGVSGARMGRLRQSRRRITVASQRVGATGLRVGKGRDRRLFELEKRRVLYRRGGKQILLRQGRMAPAFGKASATSWSEGHERTRLDQLVETTLLQPFTFVVAEIVSDILTDKYRIARPSGDHGLLGISIVNWLVAA